ncbi:MAG: hypothetical protein V3W37_10390 [Candidatus Binatia bacterium]
MQGNVNREITLLASAARTVEADSPLQGNFSAKGITIVVDITVDPATAVITPNILMRDPVSGKDIIIWTAAAALGAVGTTVYQLYPGAIAADFDGTEAASIILPHKWTFRMTVGNASSMTYSVGASYHK